MSSRLLRPCLRQGASPGWCAPLHPDPQRGRLGPSRGCRNIMKKAPSPAYLRAASRHSVSSLPCCLMLHPRRRGADRPSANRQRGGARHARRTLGEARLVIRADEAGAGEAGAGEATLELRVTDQPVTPEILRSPAHAPAGSPGKPWSSRCPRSCIGERVLGIRYIHHRLTARGLRRNRSHRRDAAAGRVRAGGPHPGGAGGRVRLRQHRPQRRTPTPIRPCRRGRSAPIGMVGGRDDPHRLPVGRPIEPEPGRRDWRGARPACSTPRTTLGVGVQPLIAYGGAAWTKTPRDAGPDARRRTRRTSSTLARTRPTRPIPREWRAWVSAIAERYRRAGAALRDLERAGPASSSSWAPPRSTPSCWQTATEALHAADPGAVSMVGGIANLSYEPSDHEVLRQALRLPARRLRLDRLPPPRHPRVAEGGRGGASCCR